MTPNRALKSPRAYQVHRQIQREHILEVAESLMVRDGIDRVSLSEIAREARLTRATLYEYFPNKEEIAWAVYQKISEVYCELLDTDNLQEANGFARIEQLMQRFISTKETHPEHMRFVVEFNTLYAREGNPKRVRQYFPRGQNQLAELVSAGIADGSLRPDLDPELLAASIYNLMNAVGARFALLGDLIEEEYDQPVLAMYQEICRAFLRGIRNQSIGDQQTCNQ